MKALFVKAINKKKVLFWLKDHTKKIKIQLIFLSLLGIVATLCGVLLVISSKDLIDSAVSTNRSGLIFKCFILLIVAVINLALQSITSIVNNRTATKFEAYLKEKLFEKVLDKDWIKVTKFHSGDLMTRFTSDISIVANGITGIIPSLFALFTQLIAAFYVLFALDSTFAFIALILGPTVVVFGRFYSKKSKQYHILCQESDSEARSFLQEALQSLLLIKTFINEGNSKRDYGKALSKNVSIQNKRNTFSVLAGIGLSLCYWAGYIFAICWGSFRLSTGFISFGTMTAFIQLIGQVQHPFTGLAKTFPQVFSVIASSERLIEIENIPDEISKTYDFALPEIEIEKIVFEDVSYSYDKEKIFENVNIDFKNGDYIILAGPSGEGKTTLLRMLLGLIAPESGSLFIKGKNGEHISISSGTRKYFTYVPQGNFIVSGTIEDNIKYGQPDASDEEMIKCAKAACIYDFISEQPLKFKTVIGERGLGLSEGQAQRIAIARALMREAPVILLDEATSALDQSLEKEVLENIEDFAANKILIFVSHRKSVNRCYGRTIFLENGCFIEKKANRKMVV